MRLPAGEAAERHDIFRGSGNTHERDLCLPLIAAVYLAAEATDASP